MSFEKGEYTLRGRPDGLPPLPPRQSSSHLSPHREAPPAYSVMDERQAANNPYSSSASWSTHDPRSSSTQSLVPEESDNATREARGDARRTLLLVYIHGFMGNETSFQSFPAHIHNLTTVLLAETHVVHTKLYPRYAARNKIDIVCEKFSSW